MEANPPVKFKFKDTTATKKTFALKKRIRAIKGGTSASKTISILIWLIDYCQSKNNRNKLCSIVSESFPHLSLGAILDFQNIMKDRGYWDQDCWHDTKHTYTFETGNKIEFYSVDFSKAHGPRRDVLFINEAPALPWNVADQLITRTREIVWLDWNPYIEFWFDTEILPYREDVDFITLTYLDNEALDEETVKEIEAHKRNKNWWLVYGLGQIGAIEARIYTGWLPLDEIPPEAKLLRRGVDYGYSNDPTAIVDIYKWNDAYIWDEVMYRKRLSNKDIADIILNEDEQCLVVADSAEPKSNDEMLLYGVNIVPANKGAGSVLHGIQMVQSQKIFVTKRSVNLWKEYKNYLWMTDKDGKIINEPQDFMNHGMDAGRYPMETLNIDTGLSEVEKFALAEARRKGGTNFAR